MKARITIDVPDRETALALEAGLRDPEIRAMAITAAWLNPLLPRARARVLRYVYDVLDDPDFFAKPAPPEAPSEPPSEAAPDV